MKLFWPRCCRSDGSRSAMFCQVVFEEPSQSCRGRFSFFFPFFWSLAWCILLEWRSDRSRKRLCFLFRAERGGMSFLVVFSPWGHDLKRRVYLICYYGCRQIRLTDRFITCETGVKHIHAQFSVRHSRFGMSPWRLLVAGEALSISQEHSQAKQSPVLPTLEYPYKVQVISRHLCVYNRRWNEWYGPFWLATDMTPIKQWHHHLNQKCPGEQQHKVFPLQNHHKN